jgi:hypothetical protein
MDPRIVRSTAREESEARVSGRTKKTRDITHEQRDNTVRRRLVEFVPSAALAFERGVTVQTIDYWVDSFRRRTQGWKKDVLEPWAIAAGYELNDKGHGEVRAERRSDAYDPPREETMACGLRIIFTEKLGRVPPQNRDIIDAHNRLPERDRARLAPALDVYLQAHDLMDQVRELMKRAVAIASQEILDITRAA